MTRSPVFLDEEQVRERLSYAELIPAMAEALQEFSAGLVQQPPRTILRVNEGNAGEGNAGEGNPGEGNAGAQLGWFACMPAVYRDVMGAKLVTFYPGNAAADRAGRRLPTHMATIQLLSPATGEPLAVLDGRLITEMRTAAISAVAARLLTSPEVATLAILGSGVQARSHLQALRAVRRFAKIRVASRTLAGAQKLVEEIQQRGEPGVEARATSAEEAVREADVVVTATSSPQPVLRGEWLKPTARVLAVGAVAHDRRELDDAAMRGAVIVESRETALRESGDILLSGASIHAELGELLAGTRETPTAGVVVFKSLGLAVADLAAARLVYRKLTGADRC